jgi:hypothetical protein
VKNQFRCGIDPLRHLFYVKEFKNSEFSSSYVVFGGRTTLKEGDEKSIPALKINISWDMADLIPYLVPTPFQEIDFFSLSPVQTERLRDRIFKLLRSPGIKESISPAYLA